MTEPVRLDPGSVEAVARRVVDLLTEQSRPMPAALVDAATVARALGVSRSTVYEHAERLGARRLTDPGDGRRPRLRFDLDAARAAWVSSACKRSTPTHGAEMKHQRWRHPTRSAADLLPIRGRAA